MKFDVYCDESRPDLFSSKNPKAKYMVIGSVWLETSHRDQFKTEIHALRDRFKVGGEFKWQKVSPSRLDFYKALVDWFVAKGESLRFRCIAVEHQKVDMLRYHDSDQELGYYKFYYQMLHHWINDFNDYAIFCDFITNRRRDRLPVLKRCLDASNLSSGISNVQAIRSPESVLIQLADVLTSAAAARLNGSVTPTGAKAELIQHFEQRLSIPRIQHTYKAEKKFNVFVIDLQGGW